jgi:hypothetical protein
VVPKGLHRAVVSNEYTAFHTSDALRIRKEFAGGPASVVAHDEDWEIFDKLRWDTPLPSATGHVAFTCNPKTTC